MAATRYDTRERYLVIARYPAQRLIVQTAWRTPDEANTAATALRATGQVGSVEVAYVPCYQGRTVTRVWL